MVFFKMLGGKTVVCNALIIEIILFLLKKYLMRCISVCPFFMCICVYRRILLTAEQICFPFTMKLLKGPGKAYYHIRGMYHHHLKRNSQKKFNVWGVGSDPPSSLSCVPLEA